MNTEADIVERIDAERTARTEDPLRPANPLLREAAAEITKLRTDRDAALWHPIKTAPRGTGQSFYLPTV